MYQINKGDNRIKKLKQKSFSELKLRERDHLQEWLANMPEALGEELLIIQKEFDGFDDTRERLDLLAIDKDGQLVIIENKLDDTGRDVVWQALKYASYCTNLKKGQIVDIYQKYLDRFCGGGNATQSICEFLEAQDFEEVVLNSGNEQRLILVAANFRKEVTATSLWLISHNIRVQCFKVTPYAFGEELLLDVQQIIPTPEAEEYMIGMSTKQAEEKSVKTNQRRSHVLRLSYWEQLLERFDALNIELYKNRSPGRDHWLSGASGVSGCGFHLIFNKMEVRVEVWIATASQEYNKAIFDALYTDKLELEDNFGAPLSWERLDDKKSCRIAYSKDFDCYNRENWPEMIDWMAKHIVPLEEAFRAPLNKITQELKNKG